MSTKRKTRAVKKALTGEVEKETKLKSSDLLSTGSSMLNLACTGDVRGGFPMGRMVLLVGDSDTGKSFISRTCLAEAANDKRFDDYLLIDDDAEGGSLADMVKFFGHKAADRIQPPRVDKAGNPVYSNLLEDFYDNLDALHEAGQPFIYVMDSIDALTTYAATKKVKEQKKARASGEDPTGSYGDGKAVIHSARLRTAVNKLRKTGSILILISQTRSNIGRDAMFNPKTRSGGHAPKFYCRLEMWLSPSKEIKKTVRKKQRKLGITTNVKIVKNHITGRRRTVKIPILYSSGIDDIGAMIDFLVDEGHWTEKKGVLVADEFDFEGKREKLIAQIEEQEEERDLQIIVQMLWDEIEAASQLKRKKRYA